MDPVNLSTTPISTQLPVTVVPAVPFTVQQCINELKTDLNFAQNANEMLAKEAKLLAQEKKKFKALNERNPKLAKISPEEKKNLENEKNNVIATFLTYC